MGKRNVQRKKIVMLDTDDDDNSSVSSLSTTKSDRVSVLGTEEVQLDKESLLDQALDALYEKRDATKEKALISIIEAFNSSLQHQFVEKKLATLLHQCLNCIKKGSSKTIALASHVIGLLALTVGCGKQAQEILEESVTVISQALKSGSESTKTVALLECLAIVTFVGGDEPVETERSMQIMWQLVHPKLGSNVVAVKPSAPVIAAVVSAWAFLLTTMDGWTIDPKDWQDVSAPKQSGWLSNPMVCVRAAWHEIRRIMFYLSGLLDKDDRLVRIAAGEALALIFETGNLEKFCLNDSVQEGNKSREQVMHIQGLKSKILNQVRNLSAEAGGKGSTKKDLNSQRNLFKYVLEFLEHGYCPEISMKIGGNSLQTSTWSLWRQLNFLKRFLGSGFIKHMQDNELLHDVFGFMPKKKLLQGGEISSFEKRMFRSPNSVVNKARTQFLSKQRMMSKDRNVGHFSVNSRDEETWIVSGQAY